VSWSLENAELRAAAFEGFSVPSLEERKRLVVGDFAKLIFVQLDSPAGERMWVQVTRRCLGGAGIYYEGEVNTPAVTMDIPEKTHVLFLPCHVVEIQLGDTLASVFEREALESSAPTQH
jgi:hypothetical protein